MDVLCRLLFISFRSHRNSLTIFVMLDFSAEACPILPLGSKNISVKRHLRTTVCLSSYKDDCSSRRPQMSRTAD